MDKVEELIEAPLSANQLAARYRAICEDPCYANVPGKIELDVWGRTVMTPPGTYHGFLQGRLCKLLATLGGGEPLGEVPIATPMGLFVTDAAWASAEFLQEHRGETPWMRAPQICIEIASPSNSRQEMQEKVAAYLAAGAEEIWLVYLKTKRCELYTKEGLVASSAYALELSRLFD